MHQTLAYVGGAGTQDYIFIELEEKSGIFHLKVGDLTQPTAKEWQVVLTGCQPLHPEREQNWSSLTLLGPPLAMPLVIYM